MVKKLLKIFGGLLGLVLFLFILLFAYLWINEYRPQQVEQLSISQNSDDILEKDKDYKITTWNIGYGGLDKDTDFFMDGGKMVYPISKNHVEKALDGILSSIKHIDSDFNLIQEMDENSSRTYGINEVKMFRDNLSGDSIFAYNYKVKYVPYPFPPLGRMNSGIFTQTSYKINKAFRYQQPIPHKFPTRLANLKRGFTVSYMDIKDTDKKLVLINVHLDAYESGNNGRIAQIKQIFKFIQKEYDAGNYVIVGGDFNQELRKGYKPNRLSAFWNPSDFPHELFPKDFKLVYGDNVNSSRLNNTPYNPNDSYECIIDGFIVGKNVSVKNIQVQDLGFVNSDHNPVTMNFTLK